jgi:3-phosphoshikimate 1-carboxyvinyltransferase
MKARVSPAQLQGTVRVPASKSHSIRALLIASLAEGESRIREPLNSTDTTACVRACRSFGAEIEEHHDDAGEIAALTVHGLGGPPKVPDDVIDVENSGTTLYLLTTTAALASGWTVFTGDASIRNRPAGPLLEALHALGAGAFSTRGDGKPPYCIGGPFADSAGSGHSEASEASDRPEGSGSSTGADRYASIECRTSQYLSSLLLGLPLAAGTSVIDVPLLYERPYVEMTTWWLDSQGIRYEHEGLQHFRIPGEQRYRPIDTRIPGDFSSATFLLCAAAVTGSTLTLDGLDMADPQGDKAVIEILRSMGVPIETEEEQVVVYGERVTRLGGGSFDLNAIPDALPALAATACYAEEPVRLHNVPQARMKETDRITVMAEELGKMGAHIEEAEDGLTVVPDPDSGPLRGGELDGHQDHRVVMALAVAALGARGESSIETAESAAVTFPGFFRSLDALRR